MNKLRAILVDDEESARDILESLLSRFCPQVELIGKCADLPQAVALIKKEQPDLVFLDIEMPQYAGYEIVRFFDKIDFAIVFVTAYDQYAIRAFEIAAMDYLLKPIDIMRLKTAVSRVQQSISREQQDERISLLSQTLKSKQIQNIIISDKGQQHVVPLDSIIAIEAHESYCMIHCTTKKYIASRNLKHFETSLETLPAFLRVHKSWIINKHHLKHYSKSDLTIHLSNGLVTKLSKYKKAEFEEAISS